MALEGLITDVLKIEEVDFQSLVETRVLLEKEAAALAAKRRTDADIVSMDLALRAYEDKIRNGEPAIEEDLMFHLKIANASKNNVLESLMMIITPDIVKNFISLSVCDYDDTNKTIMEHRKILDDIISRKSDEAALSMEYHLQDVIEFSRIKLGE